MCFNGLQALVIETSYHDLAPTHVALQYKNGF